jgi:hypothetical protein
MGHIEEPEIDNKLYLIKSPVIRPQGSSSDTEPNFVPVETHHSRPDLETLGYREGADHDCPQFQKVRLPSATHIDEWHRILT